ncbi:hypothetical protein ACTMU2_20730 [Cupriavidus basilensis]
MLAGRYADVVRDITVTCATDGNHGRSVAWGAQPLRLPVRDLYPRHRQRRPQGSHRTIRRTGGPHRRRF